MGRKTTRKTSRPKRKTADVNEVLGLFYRRQGPILYGFVAFFRHRPNSTMASKAYKTSSPFIIAENRYAARGRSLTRGRIQSSSSASRSSGRVIPAASAALNILKRSKTTT